MPGSSSAGEASGSSQSPLFRDPKNYQEVSLIGNGAYGTVYKAKDLASDQIVALKKVRLPLTEDGVPMSTIREISLLKQLDQYEHPNIVRLLDICHGQRLEKEQQLVLFLVFEHVDNDLATYLERCPPPGLGVDRIKDLSFQMLCGVDFLHSHRIVHRDLKPQNLLVTREGRVKLADFGLAKTYDFSMKLTSVVVTLWYRSPEVLLGQSYATQVDLWSCACIMAELYRRSPLFCGNSEVDQLERIFQVIGTPPESDWPENVSLPRSSFIESTPIPLEQEVPEICPQGKDLLQRMLTFKPTQRISAADSLVHPYFRDSGYTTAQLSPSNRSTPVSLTCSTSDDSGHSAESHPDK